MLIRKLFKYEASHQVHEAWSKRCKNSIHGHSFLVEFFFEGNTPDSAHMLMDFGIVKKYFHPFVDSFDHAHILWENKKYTKVNKFIKAHNERWISLPFNSSAEMQVKMFFTFAYKALEYFQENNMFNGWVHSVRVHETTTGYAEFRDHDLDNCKFPIVLLKEIKFSPGIQKDWSDNFKQFYTSLC